MAGGQGTRFWPWSTEHKPKQFLSIVGKEPLITQTFRRLEKCMPPENIFIVADRRYLELIQEAIPGFKESNLIAEPSPKNTAPCLILSNIVLSRVDPDANVAVVPADHYIPDPEIYVNQVKDALNMADEKFIVTSGIQPNMPHTGYGYIQFGQEDTVHVGETAFHKVEKFREKPNWETAQGYIEAGNYYWNAGMFFYNLKHFKTFWQEYAPYYYEQYIRLEETMSNPERFAAVFNDIKPESIDFALMEHIKEVKMFKAAYRWSDVGAWSSVYELNEKDKTGNVALRKNNIFIDSEDSLIFSTGDKPIAVIGCDEIAVIDTENGILISKMDELQKVKEVTKRLKAQEK